MPQKIAIIGGGIVGSATAYYLSQLTQPGRVQVALYDSGKGQATKAAAGIIAPWLSKRRNQQWYHLARSGAALLHKLAQKEHFSKVVYDQCGAIMTRDTKARLEDLYQLALSRRDAAPTIGRVQKLSPEEISKRVPYLKSSLPGVFISGGARVHGQYLTAALQRPALSRNLTRYHGIVKLNSDHQLVFNDQLRNYDEIIVVTGAWIRQTLLPLGIQTDLRPQKGQLIVLKTPVVDHEMPVLTPEGEYDLLPFPDGHLVIGATHEDDKKFELKPSQRATQKLLASAQKLDPKLSADNISAVRTGTRGYTSDFGPFFGRVPGHHSLLVGGGLGSSGLTTGPLMGKFLAEMALHTINFKMDYYTKPIQKYFK